MAKKDEKKTRKKKGFTIPVAIVAPMGMVAAKTTKISIYDGIENGMNHLSQVMTGFDLKDGIDFEWTRMKQGLFPIALGYLAHKVASKFGLNRALASAGVPWIRI